MSQFNEDLHKEKNLALYLDNYYKKLGFNYKRAYENELQHRGVDLILIHGNKTYNIDEKAQLHYINKDLPTFTFELSYFNKEQRYKTGWLIDPTKTSDYYFLITGIYLKNNLVTFTQIDDISHLKITSVDRKKLMRLLEKRNLNIDNLNFYDRTIRSKNYFGKNIIPELNEKKEGLIFYSAHLEEKPMNLQLRLNFLLEEKVAKRL